jgi:hypothetical protein
MAQKIQLPGWWPSSANVLIVSGALANIAIWVQAGEMVERGNGLVTVSSIALGVLMSFGPVEIIRKWGMMKPTIDRTVKGEISSRPNPKYYTALTAFMLILASEAVLLAPVLSAMLTGKALAAYLGDLVVWWSAGRVLVSAIALGGLAAVIGIHTPKSEEQKPEKPEKPPKSESAKPHAPERKLVRCTEPGCGMEYAWPNGKGAHYKKHHKPVQVDASLLIKKDE